MKTVIYIDELLVVNFLIAAFLLPGAGLLCGAACSAKRIAAGAAAAAASALLLLAPKLPFLLQLLVKAGCAAVCVCLTFPGQSPRGFLRLCAWYLLLNLTLAGVVSGLILTGGASGMETNNLTVYWNLSPTLLLACVTAVWLILRLLLWCFERPRPGTGETLRLCLMESEIAVQAFCDTGLVLPQLSPGRGGVMVSFPAVRQQLPPEIAAYLGRYFSGGMLEPPQPEWRLRFIACVTAAGRGVFPAVAADRVELTQNGRACCSRALVIFCDQSFPYGCGAAYSTELLDGAKASTERRTVECRV